MAYIAQYSPRPGTAAAKFPDDVPKQEKKNHLLHTPRMDADALARRNFDAIILERNLRVQGKVRKTVRRFIGFSRLLVPISAFIALGIWYAIM